MGARVLTLSGADGRAAFTGCEASAKQTTTAAVKADLMTRIYAPLPRSRLTDPSRSLAIFSGAPPE